MKSVKVSDETHRQVKVAAAKEGVTIESIAEAALQNWITKKCLIPKPVKEVKE